MFCPNCGTKLPDNSKFCGGCGSALPASPPKKRIKKWLVIALCAVAALLAAGTVYLLIPKTETVYMLTSYKVTTGGQQEYRFVYDENGNPTRLFSRTNLRQAEADYDEYGNLTEITWYSSIDTDRQFGTSSEYRYSYDDNGLIRSCKESYAGHHIATWDYSWDRRGNLTQVIQSDQPGGPLSNGIVRQDWEYDSKNRLVTEYVCTAVYRSSMEPVVYRVFRCDYRYNYDGTLESYEYAGLTEPVDDFKAIDYDDLTFGNSIYYRFTYTKNGDPLTCVTNFRGTESEQTFDYDLDGNPSLWDSYEYDDHGNLLRAGSYELEHEAVELSAEAAQRYRRWESLYAMDIPKSYTHPLASFANHADMFYYYLIPNPVW